MTDTYAGEPFDAQLMVRCYDRSICNNDGNILFNGDLVPARDCCTQFGNSYRTPASGEGGAFCFRCVGKEHTHSLMSLLIVLYYIISVVGFKQSNISISGRNTSHAVTVESFTFDSSTTYNFVIQLNTVAQDPSRRKQYFVNIFINSRVHFNCITAIDSILNMSKYNVLETIRISNSEPDEDIVLRIADSENNIALEEDAKYSFQLVLPSINTDEGIAVHFSNAVLDVAIGDPDCM